MLFLIKTFFSRSISPKKTGCILSVVMATRERAGGGGGRHWRVAAMAVGRGQETASVHDDHPGRDCCGGWERQLPDGVGSGGSCPGEEHHEIHN